MHASSTLKSRIQEIAMAQREIMRNACQKSLIYQMIQQDSDS
jgi:hypothetical protein